MRPGAIDETDGSVTLTKKAGVVGNDVIDAFAESAILADAEGLAVRRAAGTEGTSVAAIRRQSV